MIILGIGDLSATRRPGEELKTFALGSCVALMLFDKNTGAVGMAHIALPNSKVNMQKSISNPGHFADTGVPALIRAMEKHGSSKPYRNLVAKLAGGANVLQIQDSFKIGKRNVLELKKQLWKYGIIPSAMEVGGNISRTVSISPVSGIVTLSSPARGKWSI